MGAALLIMVYLLVLTALGTGTYDAFMGYGFGGRVFLVALIIFPLGFLLGLFFPSGMQVVSQRFEDTIAWAWGINGGFSVLGSILSIIFAQLVGFNAILMMGAVIYLIAILAFKRMEGYL